MDLQQFDAELRARGGEADVWVVYVEDAAESVIRGAPALKPQRGFWTRGEAYAFAYAAHEHRRWQHYHVFRVTADIEWLQTGDARTGEFDATFGRPRELTNVFVAPTEVAALMEAAR